MFALVLSLVITSAPPGPARSGPPSLEDAARRHGPAIVGVWNGESARAGFFVSSSGVAVTVLDGADDVVIELAGGERRKARVLVRDEDGLALVEIEKLEKDGLFASLGLATPGAAPVKDAWLTALSFVDGRAAPSLGGMRRVDGSGRWRLDLPVDAGAPVMSGGRVIGVVVQRAGTTSSVAVPAARITELAKRIPSG